MMSSAPTCGWNPRTMTPSAVGETITQRPSMSSRRRLLSWSSWAPACSAGPDMTTRTTPSTSSSCTIRRATNSASVQMPGGLHLGLGKLRGTRGVKACARAEPELRAECRDRPPPMRSIPAREFGVARPAAGMKTRLASYLRYGCARCELSANRSLRERRVVTTSGQHPSSG